jgi:hypothetical protein
MGIKPQVGVLGSCVFTGFELGYLIVTAVFIIHLEFPSIVLLNTAAVTQTWIEATGIDKMLIDID